MPFGIAGNADLAHAALGEQARLEHREAVLEGSLRSRLVAGFSESLNLLVADGKPIVASQSADPRSDRKVTIEVTATVLK